MISSKQLSLILHRAVLEGSTQILNETGIVTDLISFSEAYAQFGRSSVDRWIKEKLIVPVAGKRRKSIERKSLEAIAWKSNRISYLPVAER